MNVNQYDIVLDLLIVNQTSDTLQNVTLELATLGKESDVYRKLDSTLEAVSHKLGQFLEPITDMDHYENQSK